MCSLLFITEDGLKQLSRIDTIDLITIHVGVLHTFCVSESAAEMSLGRTSKSSKGRTIINTCQKKKRESVQIKSKSLHSYSVNNAFQPPAGGAKLGTWSPWKNAPSAVAQRSQMQ